MDALELELNRVNTTAFIASKATSLILTPRTREKTPGGGYKFENQTPRDAQTFRIIELGMMSTPPVLTLTDGKQRAVNFWLLGEWDCAMEIDDWWKAEDGREWVVGDIVRDNGYETRGLVVERGK